MTAERAEVDERTYESLRTPRKSVKSFAGSRRRLWCVCVGKFNRVLPCVLR